MRILNNSGNKVSLVLRKIDGSLSSVQVRPHSEVADPKWVKIEGRIPVGVSYKFDATDNIHLKDIVQPVPVAKPPVVNTPPAPVMVTPPKVEDKKAVEPVRVPTQPVVAFEAPKAGVPAEKRPEVPPKVEKPTPVVHKPVAHPKAKGYTKAELIAMSIPELKKIAEKLDCAPIRKSAKAYVEAILEAQD